MLTVRRSRQADEQGAVAVWRAASEARGRVVPAARATRVREKLADPASLSMVALDQGVVVGMALGEPGRHDDGQGPVDPQLLHLSMVFVDPACWGAGVGRALLDQLFADAMRAGYRRASVWTAGENERARRLYASAGMRPTGRTKGLPTHGVVVQFSADLRP
jgi:ribosomal protein S18 acetylase RimI-like enzyme